MRRPVLSLLLGLATLATAATPGTGTGTDSAPPVALVVHGGAGSIHRDDLSAEREAEYRAALRRALAEGHAVLRRDGSALDAVEAAIRTMEDSPLFNAGKGAVFTADGRNELDASIMVGGGQADDGRAGAVASVTTVRNPIS
ncbi:MAG: isoaspartyl peptidase/L-asparaginase, partial [Thermoanaerobaculia bacterium]|nr:isoaspartyl peptidase/L-asparaginase [Thermoanaerobaculia bacterium]